MLQDLILRNRQEICQKHFNSTPKLRWPKKQNGEANPFSLQFQPTHCYFNRRRTNNKIDIALEFKSTDLMEVFTEHKTSGCNYQFKINKPG